jgi:hypothetical protein
MNAEPIIPLCTHIKTNGRQCQSPALNGETLCYFHNRLRVTHQRPESAMPLTSYSQEYSIESDGPGADDDPFVVARAYPHQNEIEFPPLEDVESVQLATSMLFQAIATGQIHFKRARLLLYTLKIAAINQRVLAQSRAADSAAAASEATKSRIGVAAGFSPREKCPSNEAGFSLGPASPALRTPTTDPNQPAESTAAPSATEEIVPATEEIVPATEEIVPATEEIVPATEEIVPATKEIVPATEEIVPEIGRDFSPGTIGQQSNRALAPATAFPHHPTQIAPTPNPHLFHILPATPANAVFCA